MIDKVSLYWATHGKSHHQMRAEFSRDSHEALIDLLMNTEYNRFLSKHADVKDMDDDRHQGRGKRLPYIGWYWGDLDFANKKIPIGFCGDFVGFIANNKWDYDERLMTPAEVDTILEFIDEARDRSRDGGDLTEIVKNTQAALDKIWDYMQTLEM